MDELENKLTASLIFVEVQKLVEKKIPVPREAWMDIAFKLDVLRLDEAKLLNEMRQKVKARELQVYKAQEKKNKSAAALEIEASDEYRFKEDQEALIYSIDELIRIAKKGADLNF